jgi:hypothetical protein
LNNESDGLPNKRLPMGVIVGEIRGNGTKEFSKAPASSIEAGVSGVSIVPKSEGLLRAQRVIVELRVGQSLIDEPVKVRIFRIGPSLPNIGSASNAIERDTPSSNASTQVADGELLKMTQNVPGNDKRVCGCAAHKTDKEIICTWEHVDVCRNHNR